jgi:hypothetical protein
LLGRFNDSGFVEPGEKVKALLGTNKVVDNDFKVFVLINKLVFYLELRKK